MPGNHKYMETGKRTALIFQPHNDDAVIALGGALLKLKQAGWGIQYIYMTDGRYGGDDLPPDEICALRKIEAANERRLLGVEEFLELNYVDQSLMELSPTQRETACNRIVEALRQLQPQVVFVPSPNDQHPDHRATHDLAMAALEQYSQPICLAKYSVWLMPDFYTKRNDPARQTMLVGIDAVIQQKLELIRCHSSQIQRRAYDEIALHLAAYYSLVNLAETKMGAKYSELLGIYSQVEQSGVLEDLLNVLKPVMDVSEINHGSTSMPTGIES
jgi:LmbE family N-acetylglucosaminyl deacetylase